MFSRVTKNAKGLVIFKPAVEGGREVRGSEILEGLPEGCVKKS